MRLDRALVEAGWFGSRAQAQDAIKAGRVQVDGQVITKAATMVTQQARFSVAGDRHWVSRAAQKLLGALDGSGVRVPARVLDAGASTGGFTQVVLEAGAERVYAVDVGHGQLVDALRDDPRVVVRERLNLRDLSLTDLDDQPVGLVVADVSFISLRLILNQLLAVLDPDGHALLLVKPQFEVGRAGLDDRGVVRNLKLRHTALTSVIEAAAELGWTTRWQAESVLPGESGNVEFFIDLVHTR
ncbi:23S rRNA (cytidine1920-2'-O)/16S rRNA (cytidine1409-2'-O)-methyltransferase [Propionicimonas paludicola]|uniref:23S rRNA (Cytidine1920-2'-O)/16S rRNA (Cytidine1409-2'-O)-methyltransferase n=1 Tax=Propionicimonas paludicola TaxID=185243 RepID=A0A2A9CSH7_9ACTN|nr:TlyA family RNA methyltransferase [Propionicimonas paludicola]PFG16509.1 23S rRNA (cytidine1920-2'-O)/16S rRNA (cytidine1409-2'-O)-methyltransferase [Propionicimonas paludicola]